MKTAPFTFLISCALIGGAAAGLPIKPEHRHYRLLWENSPFTSPPIREIPPALPSAYSEYTLAGVSPIPSGYRVTVLHKKNPGQRITLDSDKPAGGMKIEKVEFNSADPFATVVHLSSGGQLGTLGFDQNFLKTPARTAAKPPLPKSIRPGTIR